MKLDVWLEREPPTAERLKVIAALCSALADSHGRGVVVGGLAPSQIDVGNDGVARLEAGGLGPGSPYAAPELAQGGAPTPKADIYSAAAVFYEILTGKPPFQSDPPRPLHEARPDLSQDLTDAVSACMEQDPEWRPADLSYLRAVVQKLQKDVSAPGRAEKARSAAAVRAIGSPNTFLDPAPRRRHDDRSPLTRALPVILVAVAIAGTAVAWFWYDVMQPGRSRAPAAAHPAASPANAPRGADATAGSPEPVYASPPLGLPTSAPSAAPSPAPTSPGAGLPVPAAAPPAPTSAPSARRSPPSTSPSVLPTTAAAAPEPNPGPIDAAPSAPEPEPIPAATGAPPEQDQGAGPAVIRAVAPFRLRAGALQVLDVHGSGLRSDHRARIVPLRKRETAAGFTVTRYQLRGAALLLVFVEVDGAVRPGKYGLSLVDAGGAETNAFTIEVANR